MSLLCPRCSRVLADSSDSAASPLFCMYCGQKLRDSVTSGDETMGYEPPPVAEAEYAVTRTSDGAAAVETIAEQPPSCIGGYRLLKFIGAGGMGSVYEAEADSSGQRVAVKLLSRRLASNPASVERFRQEGRLASQIAHPRCVFVLRADTDAGRPYIIMELMPGRTLKDMVDDRGPLPVPEAIVRTLDVVDGLIEAHRLGVIHRDVKPSNCFLTEDDRVKVGDFGLSKSLGANPDKQLTHSGAFLGTVLFASPEQIRGEPVGYDTDVYAVSATLYYLLTGRAPHQHESLTAALAKAISEAPPSVRIKCPLASSELDRLILKGLERDRERRFQSLEELRESLLGLLPERQVPARPRAIFLAYLLDMAILQLALIPLEMLRHALELEFFDLDHPVFNSWLTVGAAILYFWLFEGLRGATPGKRLLKLRIVRLGETDVPGLLASGIRTAVYNFVWVWMFLVALVPTQFFGAVTAGIVGTFAFLSGLLVLCYQFRRTAHGYRGLHDFASGTRTVQLPRPSKRKKLVSPYPNPLDRVMKTKTPLPDALGGFTIKGKICEIGDGGEVWIGEDKSLGRRVVLRVEPPGIGDDSLFDEPIVRPTRLRSVGHGTMIWGGGERAWIAYVAPAGHPLSDVVSPAQPLSWAEALPILEQLAGELNDGREDGTSPDVLSPEQIWVEPGGRLQLVDFPMPTGQAVAAGETKSRYPGGSFTPLGFVKQVAALMLEGAPRTGSGRIRAPLPAHASAITDRLFEDVYSSLGELRNDLATNQSLPPCVTAGSRIAHLTLQGMMLSFGLATMLLFSGFLNFFAGFGIAMGSRVPEHVVASWNTPEKRTEFLEAVRATEPADSPVRIRLEAALRPDEYPETEALLKRDTESRRADAERIQDRLNRPERYLLNLWLEQSRNTIVFAPLDARDADERLLAAKQGQATGRTLAFRSQGRRFLAIFVALILVWPLAIWPAFAFAFRGGLGYWFSGIALVLKGGGPAQRWRCGLRELLIWLPLTAVLLTALLIQLEWPTLVTLRSLIWLGGVAMLPMSFVAALRDPTRSPVDRFVGVFLVPR